MLSYEICDPADHGIDTTALEDLLERARREIDDGLLPSCQVALARHGRLVADLTFGDASPDSRYLIFSCSKALVAGMVWLLMSEGRLDVDQRVADIVPEFGTNGKDVVTIEQLLTHTSGFPWAPMHPRDWGQREARLERFSTWRLNWEPGSRFEYHAVSAHWVLAEVVERISGTDYRRFLRERVLAPLELRGPVLGVPEEHQAGVRTSMKVGSVPTAEEMEAVTGMADLDVAAVLGLGIDDLLELNHPDARAAGVPGGGGIGRAADLALYYQALLHNPGDLWDPEVLRNASRGIRCTLPDPMTGVASNRSLGLVVAGNDGLSHMRSNLGRTVSAEAFGHAGAGGQIAWADPATGLSFAYVTDGMDLNVLQEGRRSVALSSRAAVCAQPE